MSRFIVVSACAAAIIAGSSVGYAFGQGAGERQAAILSYAPPEQPENMMMRAIIISTDPQTASFVVEAIHPNVSQQRIILEVRTTEQTAFARTPTPGKRTSSDVSAAVRPPRFEDLRPSERVLLEIPRVPGPLETTRVMIIE